MRCPFRGRLSNRLEITIEMCTKIAGWFPVFFLLILFPPQSWAEYEYPGRYVIFQDSKAGYIDSSGRVVIEPQSERAGSSRRVWRR